MVSHKDELVPFAGAPIPVRRRSLLPLPLFVYVIAVAVVSAVFGNASSHPWWQQVLEGVGIAWLCVSIAAYARLRWRSRRAK